MAESVALRAVAVEPTSPIELRIEGPAGSITLGRFLEMMGSALSVLKDLDSAIAADPRGTVDWYVTRLHSSDLTAVVEPRAKQGKTERYAPQIASAFTRGLETLQREAVIPPYFSEMGIRAVGKISKGISANGVTGFRATALRANTSARIDAAAHPHTERVLSPRYQAFGSITGKLEMISVHRGRTFNIYESRTHRAVKCTFAEELFEPVKAALGKAVIARGLLARNENGDPIRLNVRKLLPWPLTAQPRIDDIYGIDPQFTGDLSTKDYLAEIRAR